MQRCHQRSSRIADTRRFNGNQRLDDILPFANVGAHAECTRKRCGFEHVVPLDAGHKAATDQHHIGRRIEQRHLTQRIGQYNADIVVDRLTSTAAYESDAARLKQFGNGCETLRVTWRDHV